MLDSQHEYFVSVHIVHIVLLSKSLLYFDEDLIQKCTPVRSYYIMASEANLLNEINENHSDKMYKDTKFMENKDLVVSLEDVKYFCVFLEKCYNRVHRFNPQETYPFGLIKSTNGRIVPYYIMSGIQLIPCILFEEALPILGDQIVNFENWELAYLNFCFMLMGFTNKYYVGNTCSMISINILKQYFAFEQMNFEEFRPTIKGMFKLFKCNKNSPYCWILQPPPMTQPVEMVSKKHLIK